MNYQETLDYLFNSLPMFQRVGGAAFRKDLKSTLALCENLGHPERKFKSIHVAGTNGKGSSSHALAAIFQSAGYKTGLYTSPHLKSFTERIRIDGQPISEELVVDFVAEQRAFLDELKPSFFEMTVGMAFWYFAQQKVDIAIVEVGMGGNFDSTNVISPELSLITNIGFDHVQFLGDTLPLIAGEKAGIIKGKVPVVISETHEETKSVFIEKAHAMNAQITFADENWTASKVSEEEGKAKYKILTREESERSGKTQTGAQGEETIELIFGLNGNYQKYNLPGILESVSQMKRQGWNLPTKAVLEGLQNVTELTGLKGRWQTLSDSPRVICDTGHNEAGIRAILDQLATYSFAQLWIIIGMVQDKDISKVLSMLPKTARYIFCEAKLPRALPADQLAEKAMNLHLHGEILPDVNEALAFARKNASEDDLIFVGGSTFVVAEIEEL
ncbi:bifunctional folylpolyglutamate synthase/dihydrofolate synthase [Algoriphagus halophytocola]|uniref:Dihydrofolate synthase/folylpolyglutamate synthase n=1 Tax=Algoriphagus halophytocola TaxID=2991499 RepID=A0ABY6MJ17_9BACT|nr:MULTISPECIES: folylpolyglutamate synthase/dihydrofolate synthase family protein [unclassified Algoriphagus]UZD23777.1 bifunctional folylpolyglutamate synthase/dihydrofolate synthase [Algoriphagus sp. TR-M5]WBL45071.1 bifunctional folylpolyglutamate synthase/dihydrofolate synthase [Algoriphagus sp. TR-M9]